MSGNKKLRLHETQLEPDAGPKIETTEITPNITAQVVDSCPFNQAHGARIVAEVAQMMATSGTTSASPTNAASGQSSASPTNAASGQSSASPTSVGSGQSSASPTSAVGESSTSPTRRMFWKLDALTRISPFHLKTPATSGLPVGRDSSAWMNLLRFGKVSSSRWATIHS